MQLFERFRLFAKQWKVFFQIDFQTIDDSQWRVRNNIFRA